MKRGGHHKGDELMKNMHRYLYGALFLLVMTGVVFAYQEGASEEKSGFDWNNLWKMAIAGVVASLLGAGTNGKFSPTDWDVKKIAQKAIIGVIVGVVAAWKGIGIDDAQAWVLGGSLVYLIDYAFKAIFKGAAISVVKAKEAALKAANPSQPPKP